MNTKVLVINKTKGKFPNLPFLLIKNKILGLKYNLSIIFINPAFSKKINFQYRNKNKATNILSFPFSKKEGEIFLCLDIIKKEQKKFNKKIDELVLFLVIHGMLHLKGMQHSSIMEKAEKKYFAQFKLLIKKNE